MAIVGEMDNFLSNVIATVKPFVIKEFGLTAVEYSLWESVMWFAAIFIFLFNWTFDIIGRKFGILILATGFFLLSLGMATISYTFLIYVLICIPTYYLLMSNMWVAIPVEEAPPEWRGRASVMPLALALIPLWTITIPWIVPTWGWRGLYLVVAALYIPFIIMWFFMKETRRFEELKLKREKGAKRRKHIVGLGIFTRRGFVYLILIGLIYVCWGFVWFGGLWFGYYLLTIRKWDLTTYAIISTVGAIVTILLVVAAGWLMDKLGRIRTLLIGAILPLVGGILLGFGPEWSYWIGYSLYVCHIIAYSWITVYCPEIFPTEVRGTAVGWANTMSRIGFVLCPLLIAGILRLFPTMEWYWVIMSSFLIYPLVIGIPLVKPVETKGLVLEEIKL